MSKTTILLGIALCAFLSALALFWIGLNLYASPALMTILAVSFIITLVLNYFYEGKIKQQKEWHTLLGATIDFAGAIIFILMQLVLYLIGYPTDMFGITLFALTLGTPVFGLLGNLLAFSAGIEMSRQQSEFRSF